MLYASLRKLEGGWVCTAVRHARISFYAGPFDVAPEISMPNSQSENLDIWEFDPRRLSFSRGENPPDSGEPLACLDPEILMYLCSRTYACLKD